MYRFPSISSLVSPPEAKPLDSFSGADSGIEPRAQLQQPGIYPPKPRSCSSDIRAPLSPPDSPWRKLGHHVSHSCETSSKNFQQDPLLYPDESENRTSEPLFTESSEDTEAARIVDEHMRCHFLLPKSKGNHRSKRFERPTRDEYMLMVSCVSKVGASYNQNPGAYLKRAREEVDENYEIWKRIRTGSEYKSSISLKSRKDQRALQPLVIKDKVPIRRNAQPARRPSGHAPKPTLQRNPTPFKRVAPKKQGKADRNYKDIPDFCPPKETLPDDPNALDVQWVASAIDLSNDPDRGLLHDAEIPLASNLRLECAQYLCVKRYIFIGRLNNYVIGKKFTKTDAQSCGHIDVNKSSKLWTAYDKVGWFEREHFEDAINSVRSSSKYYDAIQRCEVDTAELLKKCSKKPH